MRLDVLEQVIARYSQIEGMLDAARSCAQAARAAAEVELRRLAVPSHAPSPGSERTEPPPPSFPLADPSSFRVSWDGKKCVLGKLSFRLFQRLLLHPNRFVSYARLMEDVWHGVKSDPTVRSAIRHLKHELQIAGMTDLAAAITGRDHHYALWLSRP